MSFDFFSINTVQVYSPNRYLNRYRRTLMNVSSINGRINVFSTYLYQTSISVLNGKGSKFNSSVNYYLLIKMLLSKQR